MQPTNQPSERRLLAFINGDLAGYSRMMAADEAATIRSLSEIKSIVDKAILEKGGRLVDFVGDNFLAEFCSAIAAMKAPPNVIEADAM